MIKKIKLLLLNWLLSNSGDSLIKKLSSTMIISDLEIAKGYGFSSLENVYKREVTHSLVDSMENQGMINWESIKCDKGIALKATVLIINI